MEGKKRVSQERKLFVGFAQSTVEAVNPDNDGLRSLGFNIDDDKDEIEYVKDKDGVTTARIDFFMKEIKSGYLYKRSFFLEDQDVVTKVKDSMTEEEADAFIPKTQYVNATGDSFYSADKDTLPDYFTKFQKNTSKTDKTKIVYGDKKVRVAKVGEADLLAFVKTWLSELDYWDADTSILLDMDKIFSGNFGELQEQVDGELANSVVDVLGVKLDSKDGEEKQYQDVYKTALPGYLMKTLRNLKITPEVIAKWRSEKRDKSTNPTGRYLKDYEQVILDITDKAYPWKREYILAPFQEWDSEKSFANSGEVLQTAGTSSSDDADY